MEVDVKLTEMVAKRYSEGNRSLSLEIEEGSTIEDIMDHIGIPEKEYSYLMYTVNGKFLYENKKINEGDEIKLFPIVGGG